MTLSNTETTVTVQGDGLTTVFNYDFYMASSTYAVLVYTDADGVETIVSAGDFTLTGVTSQSGGTFTYPLTGSPIAVGTSLTLSRILPLVQSVAIGNQGNFYPAAVEAGLDNLTMIAQQQQAEIDAAASSGSGLLDAASLFGNSSASSATGSSVALGTGLSFSGSTLNAATTVGGCAPPQGRLTLASGIPVMTASVTNGTTVYYSPYNGGYLPLYDGSSFSMVAFTERSQLTTDATKSPAAVTTSSNYDIFGWTDAGTIRATRGPAWTSDTGRGTGAGTTELVRVSGLLLNANAITNGPAAQRGTYLGTVRSNTASQIATIFGGVGAAGGESTTLGVWNMHNRVQTALINFDTTDSWNYTTASYRVKNGSSSNRINMVIGWIEPSVTLLNSQVNFNAGTVARTHSIGVNSETVPATGAAESRTSIAASASGTAQLTVQAPLGFNYFAPIEYSAASGTSTWYGDNGGAQAKSIFSAQVAA